MEWNDLNIILAIGRSGSLSGAARALKMNHSTVFRRINAIEQKSGVRFFERIHTGYILTEAGEAAMRAAEYIDDEVHTLSRELLGRDLRLQGTIRVTAPEGIAMQLLVPHLASFSRSHPEIHIDLAVTSIALHLSRREADLAVRVTNNPPETAIGRRVCGFRFGIYASKNYLKKHHQPILEDCDWLIPDGSSDWFLTSFWKKLGLTRANIVFSSNHIMSIMEAAREGLGIAPLPCFMGDRDKKLVRVIDPPEEMTLALWLLTHPDLRHTARVKALTNYLYTALSNDKNLLEGYPI